MILYYVSAFKKSYQSIRQMNYFTFFGLYLLNVSHSASMQHDLNKSVFMMGICPPVYALLQPSTLGF